MSRLYERLCRKVNSKIGTSKEELLEKKEKYRSEYQERGKKVRIAERKARESRILYGEDSKEYKSAQKELKKSEKRFEEAERRYKREDIKQTLNFVDLDLRYDEIILFAAFSAVVTFFITLGGLFLFDLFYDLEFFEILMYVIPTLLILPASILIFVANYPEILEERLKADSIGKAPESINYMTMSLRVTPSLYRAICFSARNTEDPISSGLNKVLWNIHTRKKSSLEESFMDFAMRWGEWNEDLKRSLYAVRSAMLEKTNEGLHNTLEKANEIIIEGTKRRVEDFTNSLSTPTTILFAVGIILPLIIGAMLPMMALGGLDISSMEATENSTSEGGIGLFHIVFLMDILSPLGAFIYSYKILGNRPGTLKSPTIAHEDNRRYHALIGIVISASLLSPVLIVPSIIHPIMPLPLFWGPVCGLSYYLFSTTKDRKRERERIKKMERQFPDALFQIGSRIAEGISPESALQITARSMEGSEIGDMFKKISCKLTVNRLPLEEALFGREGLMKELPSRTIRAAMKTVVELTNKDPKEAGKTILQISNYLRDMENMDHEIKNRLSKSVGMMEGTVMVFAPLVMGVVGSLYFMLEDIFSDISNVQMVAPDAFTAVIAVYLLLMGTVITYFITGIKDQLDHVELFYRLSMVLPTSMFVFSLSMIFGKLYLAGS